MANLPYPASWEADVVLRDGGAVHVRPILPEDAERLVRFHERQSAESIYYRFFSPRPRLSAAEVERFTHVDHVNRVAFVALLGDEMMGVARYERLRDTAGGFTDEAEVAFFVDDAHHGKGLASLLLEYLAAAGRERGLRRFTASTLPTNRRMLRVFMSAGYGARSHFDDDVIEVWFDIQPTDEAIATMERRERQAEAASVRRLLAPASVAVIGAGEARGGLGHEVFRNLITSGFRGPVFPVNPHAQYVMSVRATASVCDIADPVDLAVIAVPAAEVPGIVEQCAEKGVSALVILSAGFSEDGPAGADLEQQVVATARRHGLRILGPNCLGLVNTDPAVRLHATFAATEPPAGRIGMFAASGTLAAALLDHARRFDLGLSAFVAAGNGADVSLPDLLGYWTDDDATSAVLLYMRDLGNRGRFVRAARTLSRRKPVVAVRTGGTAVGRRTPESVQRGRITEAVVAQTGIIRVGTLGQLFDVGRLLAEQPVPAGPGVAVIGNSDGAVALAADTCVNSGLELVPFSVETGGRTAANPVDLTYRAEAADYRAAIEAALACEGVHGIVVIHTPPLLQPDPAVIEVILEASARHPEVTFTVTMLGSAGSGRLVDPAGHAVPVFRFPDAPARALGRLAAYRQWLADTADDETADPAPDVDDETIDDLLDAAMTRVGPSGDPIPLEHQEVDRVLAAVHVPMARRMVVDTVEQAIAAAASIGTAVVLKGAVRDRTRRAAAAGVMLDLVTPEEVRAAWDRLIETHGDAARPMVVQELVTAGVDVSVTVTNALHGAHVALGLGGQHTDPGSEELAVVPIGRGDAETLVERSTVGRLVHSPERRDELVQVVLRLAALAETHPELRSITANPVVIGVDRVAAVDTQITVAPAPSNFSVRRLD